MRLIASFLIYLLLCIAALRGQQTVIKAGHLFDSRTGKMLSDQVIFIKNGVITDIGPGLNYNATDTLIDLSSSWVLPGLIDCHVHITENFPYRNYNTAQIYTTESTTLRGLRGSVVARQFLMHGFTTIKEIGNDANYATADVIKAMRRGWILGPTIFYSGKIIAPYGGQSRGVNIEHEHFWTHEYIDADTPEEIRKAIRRNIYFGANVIKMVSGDNGIYDVADIKSAVEEAKKSGMKVTVHVLLGGEAATNVILAGAAAIEHGFTLSDEQLKMMKEKGIFLVGTDYSFDNWYAFGMDSARARSREQLSIDRLKRAYKIGTKMAFGSDVIVDLPGLNRVETNYKILSNWKAANIPPSYILQTMTIHAAELLGAEKNRGLLAKSFSADIIALKEDPLLTIDAIQKVHFVMKEGKVVRYEPKDSFPVDRDGNRYPIKKMLDNNLWMTTNLKLNLSDSYCYENKKENCEQFGRLYTFESAQKGCALLGEGWRLPTIDEWRQLAAYYGGMPEDSSESRKKAYKVLLDGGSAEFNALLGGGRESEGKYARLNAHGFYWTATENGSTTAWFINFGKGSQSLYRQPEGEKIEAFSVRCVKKK